MIKSNNHAEIIIPQKNFDPGSEINGTIRWSLKNKPRQISLSLYWKTSGRGDEDKKVIHTLKLPKNANGEQEFNFSLPKQPYSFSGKLISVKWTLRFKSISPTLTIREDVIISPTGREVHLSSVENQRLTQAFIEPA